MKEKTVIIINDGHQITIDGNVKIEDMIGVSLVKEIDEVADDTLVHCYTSLMLNKGQQGNMYYEKERK